jgi:hypothetical protein
MEIFYFLFSSQCLTKFKEDWLVMGSLILFTNPKEIKLNQIKFKFVLNLFKKKE